ncbi:hypothetical protein PP304_gp068 [Gordonia phage Phendrix]|uniref:Uncharacterized protein n=2 Tax=Godonkavirus TaxID=2733178 RepID=A0A4D6E227_9CAUD|nr:hypothetical protein HOV33_gp069 [Gordonia phage GodonK]YP_010649112.1 hypothetical protein PP304_gp068 [Gordonia phage Phendrix]QBZ72688.1 hypothetical protein SEA_GODONK_69 [Gordonia phage GodonK]QDK02616.1 hypothetical protein SEA_PHENDRIX_68 [Gordonia phage Phendrix]
MPEPTGKYIAFVDDTQVVCGLMLATDYGCYYRDEGDWIPMDPDDEFSEWIEDWDAIDTDAFAVKLYDFAEKSDGRLTRSDV